MAEYFNLFLLLNIKLLLVMASEPDELNTKVVTIKNFVFWPNATVPFYVTPDHFDQEQTIAIMTGLSTFAFKTCVKFTPVMDHPKENEHVLLFVNPEGIKRCKFETTGHSVYEPHKVVLGYECLKSPQIDMMIMKSLGFPFEHNRLSRDLYIDVLLENVEPGAVELFTKDFGLPLELRALSYDINSVMHFGQRDHSKNGHRTILFRNGNVHQNRIGLSATDLKKIELVYGPECQKRDRQEKIELCQAYPAGVRRKREIEFTPKNLRVNRNITPPPSILEDKKAEEEEEEEKFKKILQTLAIENEIDEIMDKVFNITSKIQKSLRTKYCNSTNPILTKLDTFKRVSTSADVSGIAGLLAEYAQGLLERAHSNLTSFCENPLENEFSQRSCSWKSDRGCYLRHISTKSGMPFYSTRHYFMHKIPMSTKNEGFVNSFSYARNGNDTEITTEAVKPRRKREINEVKKSSLGKEKLNKENEKRKSKLKKKENVPQGITARRFFERKVYQARRKINATTVDWYNSKMSHESKETKPVEIERQKRRSVYQDKEQVKKDSMEVATAEETNSGVQATERKKHFPFKTSKDKTKIKDTFELMEDKKLKEERGGSSREKLQDNSPKQDDGVKHKAAKHERPDDSERTEKVTSEAKNLKRRSKDDLPEVVKMSNANRDFYNERRWPEGIVRYVITPLKGYDLADMRKRLGEVAKILHQKTCVKLEEVTQEEADNYEDYLVLDNSPDFVTGRVGGRQNFGCLELFEGGQHKQHAAMMVMSMLGFYFEVARHDRDKHIKVHMRHIRPDKLHHFEKIRDEATFSLSYDYRSATHPAWQFWRKIGKTGISTVATFKETDPDGSLMRSLGQHENILSEYDLIKINTVYGIECFTDPEVRAQLRTKG